MLDLIYSLVEWVVPPVLQGLTEVFPVSSSAHLALFSEFWATLTKQSGLGFSIAILLHMSMVLAVLVAYWDEVKQLFFASLITLRLRWLRKPIDDPQILNAWKIVWGMGLATLVTAVVAVPLKQSAENLFERAIWVSPLLIINGIILFATGFRKVEFNNLSHLKWYQYMGIGLMQGLAVMPGISRFGLVLCSALWCRLAWSEALKLAFLLSLPVILGVNGYEILDRMLSGLGPAGAPSITAEFFQVVAGIGLATMLSYSAIRFLRNGGMYAYRKLNFFGLYCIAVGLFAFCFFLTLG